jgi:oligo-1,6-glucosidase
MVKVNDNYTSINASIQEKDPNSVLNYFRSMVMLRKNPVLVVYGKYKLLDAENPNIYAYT